MTYYSQWKQDEYLHKNIFGDKKGGVFVDIGAHDGITGSNSYFFEKNLDWTGLCVEPINDRFRELQQNRKCLSENCCVYSKNTKVEFLQNEGYTEMLSGILKTYDQRHMTRIFDEQRYAGGTSEIIIKPAFTLSHLLEKHNLHEIDFLSIDVEGGEYDVLKGIDFDKEKIRVISIEDNYKDMFQPMDDLLVSKGFKSLGYLGEDKIYVNSGSF